MVGGWLVTWVVWEVGSMDSMAVVRISMAVRKKKRIIKKKNERKKERQKKVALVRLVWFRQSITICKFPGCRTVIKGLRF